ncbi:DUF1707 SHOCT-like domain-containing protein [Actinacidiphila glaucinigra]|uniref:DUF1707 SHOCT-like domain-containing protein n=1 Tax=Actinacidiphila glaucinigra TaxID=235986 RepID=UPI00367344F1
MPGEIRPTGVPSAMGAPLAPPPLRASHADRDRVVDILTVAAGDGLLSAAELDERLETALSARTLDELAPLTADLPAAAGTPLAAAPDVKDVVRVDNRGGSFRRVDRWVVPRRMEVRSEWGEVVLDFTRAVITQDTLRIDMDVRGSSLVLVTRPGIVVDADELTVAFGKVDIRPAAGPATPVGLRVVLAGELEFGKVRARPPRRNFLRWLLRRPAALPALTG